MGKYIIKRILIAIPVLIGITIIDYAIMCMAGSPLEMLQGPRISQAAVEARAIQLGLDKPFYVQYFVWLGQLLHGNMGYSIDSYQPVAGMIASHLGPTLLLMGVSLNVSVEIGRTKRKIKDIVDFGQGTVIELNKQAGAPVDIVVNGQLLARGDVVVIDDNFGVRITEIVGVKELMESLKEEAL